MASLNAARLRGKRADLVDFDGRGHATLIRIGGRVR